MIYPNKIKIAVCGSAHKPYDENIRQKAYAIGKEIANKGAILISGATVGYPYEAAKGATKAGGVSVGISPANGKSQHAKEYQYPLNNYDPIIYTGFGLQGRNIVIIRSCEAVIFIGGGSGTLNEFTTAFRLDRPLGVLKGSGKISENLDSLVDICQHSSPTPPIFHEDDPKKLVKLIFAQAEKIIEAF